MTDQPLSFSFRVPAGHEPTKNGRIYPPEIMEKALKDAQARGKLDVEFVPDADKPKPPVRIGGRLFVNPRGLVTGLSVADDGSVYATVEVTDPSSAVDRLAAIAREESTPPPPEQDASAG